MKLAGAASVALLLSACATAPVTPKDSASRLAAARDTYELGMAALSADQLKVGTSLVRDAARMGFPEAQYELGHAYFTGQGVKQNYVSAKTWWTLAADAGDARATYGIGYLHERALGGPENKAEAIRLYKLAIEKNDSSAMLAYGKMLLAGDGVDTDTTLGTSLIKKSAEAKNPTALFELAQAADPRVTGVSGLEIPADSDRALSLYTQAAQLGESRAQYQLGYLHFNGADVPRNLDTARRWLVESADQGNINAQVSLGAMYESGIGVEKDRRKALELYTRAAITGDEVARDRLTRLLKTNP